MITPDMSDEEKRSVLLRMSSDDLEAAIARGTLTWTEFDRLMPEIGGETAATIMFERGHAADSATTGEASPEASPPTRSGDQPSPLYRLVAQLLAAQEKTNALLGDILRELKRRD